MALVSRVQDGKRLKKSVYHRLRKEQEATQPKVQASATAKFLRMSATKARAAANGVRGKDVGQAFQTLMFSPKKSSRFIYKLLMSAIANAENNLGLKSDNLYVSEIMVNEGPRMKRLWARSRGSGDIQQKRMCHVTLTVKDKNAK